MPMPKGARFVVAIRRDRDHQWWLKSGGRNPTWEKITLRELEKIVKEKENKR